MTSQEEDAPTVTEAVSDFNVLTQWFGTRPGYSDKFCMELLDVEDRLFQRIIETPAEDFSGVCAKAALIANDYVSEHIGRPETLIQSIIDDIQRLGAAAGMEEAA